MDTRLPVVIMQECFTIYIRRQVDYIGKVILSKLMNDWKLMHELAVLRAIYLLGSGAFYVLNCFGNMVVSEILITP
jgi:gamma-tubulin complex component 5